jgi:hypothetical protein
MILNSTDKLFFIEVIEFCESSTDKITESFSLKEELLLANIIPNPIVFLILYGIIKSSNLSSLDYS